ncbi:hypothetical protein AAF712_000743 [Marasmius tenuissimus]|uniref:Protein YOP1 n=1 Tax=Marasmius tenuissimus TaxID=585030 RepID=A0ABR3AEK4_9AGAR|nr:hypothetical protein PM082_002591 [Marasmius tenuissimus]
MFSLICSIVCAWFAYFLPCFSTYKTLSKRPVVDADVERWCMYWTVIGLFVGFEYVAQWFTSWLPFYWEIKTLFLLFLSIPQIQGSTFIYTTYVQPFFAKNEAQIEESIISVQTNTLAFVQSKLAALWQILMSLINKAPASGQPPAPGAPAQQSQAPSISLDAAVGLFKAYAPSFLNPAQGANRGPAATSNATSPPSMTPSASSTSIGSSAAYLRPTPSPSAFQNTPPSFPEPEHYQ